jgi:hypothetical protein
MYIFLTCIVSVFYHITYGLGWTVGSWFRTLDWTFALSMGPVFINTFFLPKHSYWKVSISFAVFIVMMAFWNIMGNNPLMYGSMVFIFFVFHFTYRSRHISDVPLEKRIITGALLLFAIVMFILADESICMGDAYANYYWSLHAMWHVSVFLVIYCILRMGLLSDPDTSEVTDRKIDDNHTKVQLSPPITTRIEPYATDEWYL